MLEVYRSRIFNKRQKSRQSKRASTIHRVDSNSNGSLNKIGQPIDNINLNQFSGCCDLLNDFHTGMSSIATGGVERRLSSSSSKASLTRNQAANSNHDRILSMETDQFELMLNNLTLTYEDQLLNVLTEYFLSKEDSGLYSCSRMIRDGESLPTSQSFDNSGLSRMKKFASVSEFRENGWNKNPSGVLNRCYYASIQAHMAQSFKAMDTNFDNRLSFDEFYNGLRTVLNENCVRKLCAKSYYKFVLNLVNDETVLKRLFAKFDVNNDEYVDFSGFFRQLLIKLSVEEVFNFLLKKVNSYVVFQFQCAKNESKCSTRRSTL